MEQLHPQLIPTAEKARNFVLGGNARVTLKSKTTGSRHTFRIKASQDRNVHFVALLNGPDNESSYAYFGYIKRDVFYHGGAKARVSKEAPSARAFAWTWQKLVSGVMPAQLEVWHEGRCCRCARVLTVPESIRAGVGPECAGKVSPSFFAEEVEVSRSTSRDPDRPVYPASDPRSPDFYVKST
jgi:hypothetical protein